MSNQPFDLTNSGDLNRDGRIDSAFTDAFDADGDGIAESVAGDVNLDGRIDSTYSDLDGDGYQETALVDANLDGTLDTVWVDLDGDLLPDVVQPLPTGPFTVSDPTVAVGLDACDPQAVFDPMAMDAPAFDGTASNVAPGLTYYDPFATPTTMTDAYVDAGDVYTPGVTDAYVDGGDVYAPDMQAVDTSAFSDASWDAWNSSIDLDHASWEAWSAGDYDNSAALSDISGDWADYSQSMDYLQYDPTDSYSWDAAYDAADQASWDAWNASVDAYVAGDSAAAYEYNQMSIEASSVADSTWDASSSYSSYDDSSY